MVLEPDPAFWIGLGEVSGVVPMGDMLLEGTAFLDLKVSLPRRTRIKYVHCARDGCRCRRNRAAKSRAREEACCVVAAVYSDLTPQVAISSAPASGLQ